MDMSASMYSAERLLILFRTYSSTCYNHSIWKISTQRFEFQYFTLNLSRFLEHKRGLHSSYLRASQFYKVKTMKWNVYRARLLARESIARDILCASLILGSLNEFNCN